MRIASPFFVTLVVVAVVAALAYIGLFWRSAVERPLAYWLVDERTLEVVFLDAPNLDCGIGAVEESTGIVRIHAQCQQAVISFPASGMAQKYVFRTTLQAPLGLRSVQDGKGNGASECQLPGEDCIAPG
jgi:hypothetical protein